MWNKWKNIRGVEPWEEHFFIGRGVLDKRKFKCLKVVPLPFKRDIRKRKPALYSVPTRDELGDRFT